MAFTLGTLVADSPTVRPESPTVIYKRIFEEHITKLSCHIVPDPYRMRNDPYNERRVREALIDMMITDIKPYITVTEEEFFHFSPYAKPLRADIGIVRITS